MSAYNINFIFQHSQFLPPFWLDAHCRLLLGGQEGRKNYGREEVGRQEGLSAFTLKIRYLLKLQQKWLNNIWCGNLN